MEKGYSIAGIAGWVRLGRAVLKRFLNGLVFGAGFGIAFVAVIAVTLKFALPYRIGTAYPPDFDAESQESDVVRPESNVRGSKSVSSAPALESEARFLGSTGRHDTNFIGSRADTLAGGPGKIVGKATVDGEAVANLKLRLALNGRVYSQWTTTDPNGRYEVSVPTGTYRIDGYQLDLASANAALSGKITHPQCALASGKFEVTESHPGRGLDLKFTNPVIKKISKTIFSAAEDVVLAWEAYPGADKYSVQIYERSEPHSFGLGEPLFPWRNPRKVSEPKINLKNHNIKLKPGHYYTLKVYAEESNGRNLSETARMLHGFDFEVIE